MLRWYLVWVLLLSTGQLAAEAGQPVWVGDAFYGQDLMGHLEVAKGDSAVLQFKAYPKSRYQTGYSAEYQWVKLTIIDSSSALTELMLEASSASINEFWVYLLRKGESPQQLGHSGADFPYAQRAENYRYFIFPFQLNPGEEVEVLIKIRNDGQNRVVPFHLWTKEAFLQQRLYRKVAMSVFFGMIALILIYGAISLSILKTNVRGFYLGYVATGAMLFLAFSGLAYRILWPGSVYLQAVAVAMLECVTNIFAILLALRLFRIANYFPYVYKLSVRMCTALCVMMLVNLFTPFYGPGMLFIANQLTYLLILIVMLAFLLFPLYAYYKLRRQLAIVFLLTIAILNLALIPVILEHMGFFRLPFNPELPILLGTIIVNVALWLLMLARVRENLLRDAIIAEGGAHQQKINMLLLVRQEAVVRSKIKAEINQRVGLRLDSVRERIEQLRRESDNEKLKDGLQQALDALNTSSKELRGITENRVPSNLLELGLMGAIREITLPVEQTGTAVELIQPPTDELSKLDIIYQLTIFRIIQGLLNNVYKHAKATSVLINMTVSKGAFELIFKDNGVGYDVRNHSEGKGLEIIRKRIDALEGSLKVTSRTGSGSRFDINIPIRF